MLNELRLLVAETLLGWALALAPSDHPDGPSLVRAIKDYLDTAARRRSRSR